MSNPHITLIVLTKNEQGNLSKWPRWLSQLTCINEIIAVDDGSTDNTQKILKSLGSKNIKVKVFNRGLAGNFATQRNFATSKSTNDWILFLDPDETPSPKLINYLNNLKLNNDYCYAIKRYLVYVNHILYHGLSATDNPVRLFNKKSGVFTGLVHETWTTNDNIIKVSEPIFHYSAPSLKIFLSKLNHYSTIRAQELFNQKVNVNLLDIFLYPQVKFIQYYFWHLGFIDGIPGLIICLSMSFYSFLVRSKLWRLYHA